MLIDDLCVDIASRRYLSRLLGNTLHLWFRSTVIEQRRSDYIPLYQVGAVLKWSIRVISRHQNTRLTYDGLHRKSNALAHGLENIGVKKGDRVAVSLGNNIEFAIVRCLRRSSRVLD